MLLRNKWETKTSFLSVTHPGTADGVNGPAGFSAELPVSHSSRSIRRKTTCLNVWLKPLLGERSKKLKIIYFVQKLYNFSALVIMGRCKKVSRTSNYGNCFQRLGNGHKYSGLKLGHFYQSDEVSLFL